MLSRSSLTIFLPLVVAAALVQVAAVAQDLPQRKELKRADYNAETEVISSVFEFKPGEEVPLHFHHGVETAYVLQGTMIQYPGKDPQMLAAGTALVNLRDAKHAGFKVVGDQSLKIYTVHVVDKGKPLYDYSK